MPHDQRAVNFTPKSIGVAVGVVILLAAAGCGAPHPIARTSQGADIPASTATPDTPTGSATASAAASSSATVASVPSSASASTPTARSQPTAKSTACVDPQPTSYSGTATFTSSGTDLGYSGTFGAAAANTYCSSVWVEVTTTVPAADTVACQPATWSITNAGDASDTHAGTIDEAVGGQPLQLEASKTYTVTITDRTKTNCSWSLAIASS